MQIAKNRYNPYVVLIENAQSDVREIVKNAFLTEEPKATTEKKLITSIRAVTSKITINDLRSAVARSLGNYANVQRKSWKSIGLSPVTIYFLLSQSENKKRATDNVQPPRNATVKRELKLGGTYEGGRALGVPTCGKSKLNPCLMNYRANAHLIPTIILGIILFGIALKWKCAITII